MKKRNTILLLTASCLIAAGAAFGVTHAYLKASDATINKLEVGKNDIKVTEQFKPPRKLQPGETFKKIPQVQNTGDVPCFVRVRADFSDSSMEALCEFTVNTDKNNVPYDASQGGWTEKQPDGYYYYKHIVPVLKTDGEGKIVEGMTPPLFKANTDENGEYLPNLTISGDADMNDMEDFDILIYAESVGAGEYTDENYWLAWGLKDKPTDPPVS